MSEMASVVVDIDDTLIDTGLRMQSVWRELLGREISMEAVETMGLEQIFTKYASQEQMTRVRELQKRFWDILLCLEESGIESLRFHKPIPFASDVLQAWKRESDIVYLTGRTENMRTLTLEELRRFGFPTETAELFMFKPEDYARPKGEDPSGPTLIDTKSELFSKICKRFNVVRVIDDYPGYFPIFKQFDVPDRIGFLRPRKYSSQHYIERGATRVIRSWRELEDDIPR